MAPSRARTGRPGGWAFAACAVAGAVFAAPPDVPMPAPKNVSAPKSVPATPQSSPLPTAPSRELPITVDAASSEVDYKTNTVVFRDVVITQGTTRVQADHAHASGLNFANSRWTFDGNVRMEMAPRGNLRADQAVVEFKDNHIARATITGKPAEFEQLRTDSQQMAHGHANEILYDVTEGTVRLSDDAWLTDGQNEISGPLLVYNIREQRVQAATEPGTGQRVHITIAPQSVPGTKSKSEPPAKPPPNPPP
jgi:lipopolysaccharide transport protein LptA